VEWVVAGNKKSSDEIKKAIAVRCSNSEIPA
jgi:hypothetical protein